MRATKKEAFETAVLALLSFIGIFFFYKFANGSAGLGPNNWTLGNWFYALGSILISLSFFSYAYKVYFKPQYGRSAIGAMLGTLLFHVIIVVLVFGKSIWK